jgi:hypothetical protein
MIRTLVLLTDKLFPKEMLNFIFKKYFTKNAQLVVNLKHARFKGVFKCKNPTKCKIIDEMQKIIVKKH